jgi:hypothetical protein
MPKANNTTATAKPVKQKPAKPNKPTPAVKETDPDREAAKLCGIGVVDLKILRFLRRAGESTYKQIAEGAVVSYNPLTKTMRKEHEGSLCHRGLTKEVMREVGNRQVLHFDITQLGRKKIEKAR